MTKIYYGVDKVPPGQKPATMVEAAKAGQVRRWGLFAIDPMLLAAKFEVAGPAVKDYRDEAIKARGVLSGIQNRYKLARDPMTKKALEGELKDALEKYKKAAADYEKFKNAPTKQTIVAKLDTNKIKGYKKQQEKERKAKQAAKKAQMEARRARIAEKKARKEQEKAEREEQERIRQAQKQENAAMLAKKRKEAELEKARQKAEKIRQKKIAQEKKVKEEIARKRDEANKAKKIAEDKAKKEKELREQAQREAELSKIRKVALPKPAPAPKPKQAPKQLKPGLRTLATIKKKPTPKPEPKQEPEPKVLFYSYGQHTSKPIINRKK